MPPLLQQQEQQPTNFCKREFVVFEKSLQRCRPYRNSLLSSIKERPDQNRREKAAARSHVGRSSRSLRNSSTKAGIPEYQHAPRITRRRPRRRRTCRVTPRAGVVVWSPGRFFGHSPLTSWLYSLRSALLPTPQTAAQPGVTSCRSCLFPILWCGSMSMSGYGTRWLWGRARTRQRVPDS